jgi:capsular exopolysaccharide synthesis family protein
VAIGVVLGATLYVEALPAEYEATSVAAFAPRADVPTANADAVRLVLPKYVAYLESPQATREVAAQVGLDPAALEHSLKATPEADSGNLTVAVTLGDPNIAAEAANAYVQNAVSRSVDDELLAGEVVARAVPPSSPSGPPRRLFEAAALVVGALLGISVALLVERARPRIRSWRDIYQITGYTVMGRIPRARVLKGRPSEGLAHPMVGAAFRTLRTNVERLAQDREMKLDTIVVTSPTSGDGKTTISSLFAEALARLGSRVLLVDADIRRANFTNRMGLKSAAGLSSVLRKTVPLKSAVQAGWIENLWVLPTAIDHDAGDLIAKYFADFLSEAHTMFDIVVIDTPPLLGTDEGRTITTLATGVLLVVRAGSMSGPVNEGALALEGLRAPVLGAVGNRLRRAEVGQYYN